MSLCRRPASIVALVVLLGAAASALAQPPDRTTPPKPGPPPALTLPPIQKQTLSNGLAVWIIEQHEVPVAQVNLIVKGGSAADPAGSRGVASMTANMLDEGAGGKSALELSDAVEFLGAELSTTSTFDYSAVRLSTPVARLPDALPLMASVALAPSFPAAELERLRKERLTRLLQARDDPAAIIEVAFPRLVFGADHRYGSPAGGTAADVTAMTLDQVRAFHRTYYRPELATLLVVGDITAAAVLPLLEKAFGAWAGQGAAPAMPTVPAAPQLTARRIYIVDKPGAAQSQIRIGWVGVPRSTPEYPTLQVLNTILGGSFTSRLNTNLRETHGYSYGAFSGFEERLSAGTFSARAGVQTDKTARSAQGVLQRIHRDPPADSRRRAGQSPELRRPRIPGRVREQRTARREDGGAGRAWPAGRVFPQLHSIGPAGIGARRRAGGDPLHPARQVRRRHRRRSHGHRSGGAGAGPRADRVPDRGRRLRTDVDGRTGVRRRSRFLAPPRVTGAAGPA